MKKRTLLVLLAALGMTVMGCNNGGSSTPTPEPGPVEPETVSVESVSLDKTSETLKVGGTLTLTATVLPANATDKSVTWESSNAEIASVNAGVVTAKAAGQATITVKTTDGNKTATCAITVEENVVHVESVSLNKNSTTLEIGGTETLTATVLPATATDKSVTWESSNAEIASVNAGVVTAKAAGQATITVKTTDGNKTATCAVTVNAPAEPIEHQTQFVKQVENPSTTRAFREEFDEMIEDFSGESPSGATTGEFTKSFLRVLVDNEAEDYPSDPEQGTIYKVGTGNYAIEEYDGIGFTMRMVGNGALNLSNLALNLRGDNAFKTYPIKLGEALDADGEALPELSDEYQEFVVSPMLSIEDSSTEYELVGGGASGTKVLEKILGFHLTALDEECSAILEISRVYLVKAGEITVLDSFNREKVNKADDTCWWRDSYGFIVQKGVTLNDKSYTTKDITLGEYQNLVLNMNGDASGLQINGKTFAELRDDQNNPVTNTVNGAFYPYVINLANSGLELVDGKFTIASSEELVISQIFLTNLVDELPAENYPFIDIANASYATNFEFTMAKGTIKNNYNDACEDTRKPEDLNYVIAYPSQGYDDIEIDGHDLVFHGGDYEYANTVIGSNADAARKYVVFAMKTDAKPSGFRFKLGKTANHVYLNDMLADAGLPSWSDAANYPYITEDGYKLVIVDLARNGLTGGNNEIEMYYTGTEDLRIGAIFFANDYKPTGEIKETTMYENTIEAGAGYAYVNGYELPADAKYVHIETTATVANELRFEGNDGAKYLNAGAIIDIDGNPVVDGSKDFIIDLVASGIKAAGETSPFHTHSTKGAEAFTLKASLYEVIPAVEEEVTKVAEYNVEAGEGYAYAGGYNVPAEVRFIKVESTAAVANELRFEGFDGVKYLSAGAIIDIDGNPVVDGSTEFIMDLEASGLKEAGVATTLHTHTTKGATAFSVILSTVKYVPVKHIVEGIVVIDASIEAGEGYAYVGGYSVPENVRYLKVETTAAVANLIRFAGADGDKWLNAGSIIDIDGNPVADGSSEYIIDLVASGLKVAGTAVDFHAHSNKAENPFEMTVTVVKVFEDGSYEHLLSAYHG